MGGGWNEKTSSNLVNLLIVIFLMNQVKTSPRTPNCRYSYSLAKAETIIKSQEIRPIPHIDLDLTAIILISLILLRSCFSAHCCFLNLG